MKLKRIIKNAILLAAKNFGVNACVRVCLRDRLIVLCYHSIIPDDYPDNSIRICVATRLSDFRRQLEIIGRLFNPLSAQEVVSCIENGKQFPPYSIVITFDDGFRNNLTLAAPEMERLGIPGIFFVTTGHVGGSELLWPNELDERVLTWEKKTLPMPQGQADLDISSFSWDRRCETTNRIRGICKTLPNEEKLSYLNRLRETPLLLAEESLHELYDFLTWNEVRELDKRGFSIGSHTVTHPILTKLSSESLDWELSRSKSTIESELNKPCPWIAYPNGGSGDFSPEVMSATKRSGYKAAFSLVEKLNPRFPNPFAIDRICIPGILSDVDFHARLNGFLSLLRG